MDQSDLTPRLGTNGLIQYRSRQEETPQERGSRERYWRSLGKQIRKGIR